MPTYEYACTECGEPLEAVQKFSDPALTECPVCGGRLRKVFSAAAIVFKGSGFYHTDSRGSSKGSATVAAKDTAKKTEDEVGVQERVQVREQAGDEEDRDEDREVFERLVGEGRLSWKSTKAVIGDDGLRSCSGPRRPA